MKKGIISVIMVFVLSITATVPVLAAGYKDLEGHWAKDYMLDLAEKGYLTGSDGAMRPNANITAAETLTLLSRFYKPSDPEFALIQSDYQAIVTESVPASFNWAYKNLAVCLAAGIVTELELKSMSLGAEMKKEQLSFYLVRALQLTEEAQTLSGAALTFTDAELISDSCRGSVAKLVAIKIVGGDDAGRFLPQSSLTRAVAATMISRALDYLKTNSKTLVVESYSGLSRLEGIITSVGAGRLDIRSSDGLTRDYTVPVSARVTVNGAAKALSALYVGFSAVVSVQNGSVVKVEISENADVAWVQGAVNSISSSSTTHYLYIRDLSAGTVTRYTIPAAAVCTRDGTSIAPTAVKDTDFVTLKIEKGFVTRVDATSGSREVSGVVSEISYGTTVTLKITDNAGTRFVFLLDIAAPPQILRGSTPLSIDRLKTGGAVTVMLERCQVATIVSTGTETTRTGELTSISATKSGTVWVITADDGTALSLTVDENAGVYSGSKSILLSDIKIGDRVSVVVYNNVITEINLTGSVTSSDKVTGSVLALDAAKKIVTMLTPTGKLIYINTSSVVTIVGAETGRSAALSSITPDTQIVAYGVYSDSTHFNAKLIIIE
ncbi:MAG: S-layer homology domain-containing protein [Clostridiales bacterium]|nr:S-layer homology domain-containing protein [Clostridiales bacterium]